MAGGAGIRSVRDEVERVARARVLGQAAVVEVRLARLVVEDDVLEHGAEAIRRLPDLRLGLGGETDGLGVAAALEVEDALLRPAVLVVTQQDAVRIGRQRRLAGAREAEEHSRVGQVRADVGRAVHRHDVLRRQHVVEEREHALLGLARVRRAGDQHDAAREIARDHGLGAGAVTLGRGLEARKVDDRELGRERRKLGRIRAAQHVANEQRVPGELGEHARREAVTAIGAGEQVLDVQFLVLGVGGEVGEQVVELLAAHALRVVPPDRALGLGVADDELVVRRAAGVLAGLGHERAGRCQLALALADGGFDEHGLQQVVPDVRGGVQRKKNICHEVHCSRQ